MRVIVHPRARHLALRTALRPAVLGALFAALLAGGVVAKVAADRAEEARYERAATTTMRAEAGAIRRVTGGRAPDAASTRRLTDLLRVIAARSGTTRAVLVDEHGIVVASGTPSVVRGAHVRDAPVAQALARGGLAAGGDGARALAVDLGGRRHALAVTRRRIGGPAPVSVADIPFVLIAVLLAAALVAHRVRRGPSHGLPPGEAFDGELARAAAHAARHVEPLSLILLRAGGRLRGSALRRVARILHDGRLGDRAFRASRGGTFAVLLPRTGLDGAVQVAQRLTHRLARAGVPLHAAAGSLQPGQGPAELRAEVEAALRRAHAPAAPAGGEAVAVAPDRARALDAVLSDGDLTCHFQPIWDLRSGELLAVEALARVPAAHGFEGPSQAFDAAERAGRVHELDTLCVRRALEGAARLPAGASLFVNVAPQTLDADAGTDPWLADAVRRSGLDPSRVVVEVTERVGAPTETVLRSIARLRAAGLRIAIDDVGVGNSGLEMLRRVRPDFVKIDRSVVTEARHDPGARAVVAAIATFASETGAFVIAEGIEDGGLLDALRDAPGIDGAQGFALGRPAAQMPTPQRALAAA